MREDEGSAGEGRVRATDPLRPPPPVEPTGHRRRASDAEGGATDEGDPSRRERSPRGRSPRVRPGRRPR
ncbi:hypothetical protein GCM10009756_06300 [Pseudokineococcus marinus]